MLEQPDSPTASHTKQYMFDHYLRSLQSEIHTILSSEADYEARLKSLQNESDVFRRQCFALADENRHIQEENCKIKAKLEVLESKIKNSEQRIVCLIDGDGTIFSVELLAQGQDGGRRAARQLTESIQPILPSSTSPCSLWVYIFYNKRGLVDTLRKAGPEYRDAYDRFEDFVVGFNQSCERFIIVDVGYGKEAADAKMKACLEDHARSIQTHKIIFGGCHDNGYIHTLRSLLTTGHRDKIVLLPGYAEMSFEFRQLQLPTLTIPDLFLSDKIAVPGRTDTPSTAPGPVGLAGPLGPPPGLPTPSTTVRSPMSPAANSVSTFAPSSPQLSESNTSSSERTVSSMDHVSASSPGSGISYRSALQTLPLNSLSSPGKVNGDHFSVVNSHRPHAKPKRIDFTIPLHKNNPPPCTSHYLGNNGCKFGDECRFSHDYNLEDDDEEKFRVSAKKWPCTTLNRDEICQFGDECFYGHSCPFASKCVYYKQGKCKFIGISMHRGY